MARKTAIGIFAGRCRRHQFSPSVDRRLDLTPEGVAASRLAATGATPNVTLFDLHARRALSTLAMIGSDTSHVALRGSTLAVAVKPPPTVCLFDLRTGQELARLDCDGQELDSITFSPDGTRLIATGEDGGKRGRFWEWTIRKRQ
jgi:WD40 repeat protein